jgi:hypothetical protein
MGRNPRTSYTKTDFSQIKIRPPIGGRSPLNLWRTVQLEI